MTLIGKKILEGLVLAGVVTFLGLVFLFEIIERLDALEKKVSNSKLLMKRTVDGEYERLVDVVVEHDRTITEIVEHTVGTLTEGDDTNW